MTTFAENIKSFWEDRKRGYFWYEDAKIEDEAEQKKQANEKQIENNVDTPKENYSYDELLELHPDIFKVVVENRLKTFIHKPTEENTIRFFEINKAAKDKARMVANIAGYVASQHPEMEKPSLQSTSTVGKRVAFREREKQLKDTLSEYKEKYAIIVFQQEGCSYCDAQEEIIDNFEFYNRWTVRHINIQENPVLADKFNIETTPTILLVSKDTNDSKIISTGIIALKDLELMIVKMLWIMEGIAEPKHFNDLSEYR